MQTKEQKISPIKQRILQFAATLGISKRDFYTKIGVSRGTLESGTGITEDIMAKFIATYPHISSEWLLTGKGNMLKESEKDSSAEGKDKNIDKHEQSTISIDLGTCAQQFPYTDNAVKGIPLIPLSAMAGAFTGDTSVMEYECERYVIPAFKGADFLIQVKGDSMQPTYYSGDLVACERVPLNDIFFQWNKTYVLDTKQGPLIKRIMPGSDNEHILIVSDNNNYPPFELSKDQFYGVALVRGIVRLE